MCVGELSHNLLHFHLDLSSRIKTAGKGQWTFARELSPGVLRRVVNTAS